MFFRINAIFPTNNATDRNSANRPVVIEDRILQNLESYARKVECDIYDAATSKVSFLQILCSNFLEVVIYFSWWGKVLWKYVFPFFHYSSSSLVQRIVTFTECRRFKKNFQVAHLPTQFRKIVFGPHYSRSTYGKNIWISMIKMISYFWILCP